jgi:hypothetical protein
VYSALDLHPSEVIEHHAHGRTLLLWLYLTAAAIFIRGQANSEIEKAAAEAGHSDVRATGEQRAGA